MKKDGFPDGKRGYPFVLIFTDLDGTLLDPISYGWEEAKPALNLCRHLHIPIILVSSKTRPEMNVLRHKMGLSFPFIVENGGGIFFPKGGVHKVPSGTILAGNIWKWSLGMPYDRIVSALREIREELGWNIRGFSEMTTEEISRLTGLDLETSRLASEREYDEPCIVSEQGDFDADFFYDAARKRGLNITMGGRFYHIQGKNDKGEAVKKVISWYKEYHHEILTIALGDSPNDFSMLKQVDYPVLLPSALHFHGIEERIPGLRVIREIGPKGWNSAVLDILNEKVRRGVS